MAAERTLTYNADGRMRDKQASDVTQGKQEACGNADTEHPELTEFT